ncbi:hypothetical protein E1263_01105 [Kribbella antibiotica]|uniref:DUF6351 domain-containing protein n=1 Tax=Kribbella antibiotica TaxID=190195 RepID=A0A4R4ZY40_9ACTN|nr:DUF6351 family protein [Kribbella antibiotica]TDD63256.1 hypothetical protein E1263_01105 [Kribbella antibiotica]
MSSNSLRAVILAAALVGTVAAPASATQSPGPVALTVLSNTKPEYVSGGDVLVKVSRSATVKLNGRDITAEFAAQPDQSLLGLVTGLRTGANVLTAGETSLRVTSYPLSGPIFSGPQQVPFYCETTAFGLAPAAQPLCEAPTKVTYRYRTTAGAFVVLPDPAVRPADLATTVLDGRTVPYIVRVETGTIDRAVYQFAALYDGTDPTPLRSQQNWNRKLVYAFGGGCNAGFHQGNQTGNVLNDLFLSQGYAVASSTLNVPETNCSTVISGEAAMMVKEHFIETYGPTRYTIGWGGSGGSVNQHEIADGYPGILDGIVPGVSFPDMFSAFTSAADCSVLNKYFAGTALTEAQKTAITGFVSSSPCVSWQAGFGPKMTPIGSCNRAPGAPIPPTAFWDPVLNPTGIKCMSAEQWVTQLGRDPKTGLPRSVRDNIGVQYGLHALQSGAITPAQFADLNAKVGSVDPAGQLVAERATADPAALRAAYRSDLQLSGGLGLRSTPIIDQRSYADRAGFGIDIHTAEVSFVTRDRLLKANGTAANQVIIMSSLDPAQSAAASRYELDAMDRWLAAITADGSHRSAQQKVIANKPADLKDGCYLSAIQRVDQPLNYPPSGPCGATYPVAANPRIAAGSDIGVSKLKCALKPLNFSAYQVAFTAADRATLRKAFPSGVCDYTRPGIGQQPPAGTWLNFSS